MVTKLKDYVRYKGKVTTIEELTKEGKIDFRKSKFASRRTKSGYTDKYFADIKGTMEGWEIGKTAYLGRIGKKARF